MKNTLAIPFTICAMIFSSWTANANPHLTLTAQPDTLFPRGAKVTNNNFRGDVWLQMLVQADSLNQLDIGCVTFAPGARTRWHLHPAGQILMVTDGKGYYQEKGQAKKILRKGDVIKCPPDVPHWHGASADSGFVQVAITGRANGPTAWQAEVTDQEYYHGDTRVAAVNNALNARQQSMVAIAALTAKGDIGKLKTALHTGLQSGLTINETKEMLVHLSAYCGFPRTLNAINTLIAVTSERKASGITDADGPSPLPLPRVTDKYAMGRKTLELLTGRPETGPKTGYAAFVPVIDTLLKEHLFADIFSRGVLSNQDRELTTVSALVSLGGVDAQLQGHLSISLNTGLTAPQLRHAISIVESHTGKEQAEAGRAVLTKVVGS